MYTCFTCVDSQWKYSCCVLSSDIDNCTARCVWYSERAGSLNKPITVASSWLITCVLNIDRVTYVFSACTTLCLYEIKSVSAIINLSYSTNHENQLSSIPVVSDADINLDGDWSYIEFPFWIQSLKQLEFQRTHTLCTLSMHFQSTARAVILHCSCLVTA